MKPLTLHLVIHGRVQGVFFRESMRQQADTLGVKGWARNRADGTVEAVIQGSADAVDTLLQWARSPAGAGDAYRSGRWQRRVADVRHPAIQSLSPLT
jgi:acylphosphatase